MPFLPKETILPSSTFVAPAKLVKFIVEPSERVTFASFTCLPCTPTVEDPPPIATALACGAWAPVPIATEFIPVASDIVPIARAISPDTAFTPSATEPCPASLPLYFEYVLPSIGFTPSSVKISPLPVNEANNWFKFLFSVVVFPIWFPFLSKIFFW